MGLTQTRIAGLVEQVFLHDPLCAVAPAGPGFPPERPITWKQLARLPLAAVKPGYGVRRRIERAAQTAGVPLCIEHEVSLLTTAVALAASGLGVAVVPRSMLIAAQFPHLAARRITRPQVERPAAVVFKSDRALAPAAAAFAELLAREFGGAKS